MARAVTVSVTRVLMRPVRRKVGRDLRRAMQHEQRVLVRVSLTRRARPTPASQFRPGRRRLARWRPPADAMSG